jgi:hypothetical protein
MVHSRAGHAAHGDGQTGSVTKRTLPSLCARDRNTRAKPPTSVQPTFRRFHTFTALTKRLKAINPRITLWIILSAVRQ